jgi:serine/threonine-protein kinase
MAADRWNEIEALFHAAQDCPPDRRAELLAQADPDVRREVESLLAQRSQTGPLDRFAVDLLESGEISAVGLGEPVTRLELGPSFGSYTLVSTLGRGGMGEVLRARDPRLDRDVAIKVMSAPFVSDPERVARFRREAKTLAALNHPNIAAIYGLEEHAGTMGLVLELVEGPTVADRIAQGPVHIYYALLIATQIAEALEAAHERGIVHRDLKPANIKLRPDGVVKVLDFGLAKRPTGLEDQPPSDDIATRGGLTRAGIILGTVGYMSPEQAAGRPADLASDQFSFGVILYELLTGRRPFERPTSVEILSAIIRDDPPPVQDINPSVSSPLQQVIERCLRKHPRERYSDTRQLAADMRQIRDHWDADPQLVTLHASINDAETSVLPVVAKTHRRLVTRRQALWLTGGLLAALSAAVAGWRIWPAGTGVRVLAVLPFTNVASDPDVEYLSDGITESLIQQISRLPSLTVMARSTVFNFKGKAIDPREAGRQLGVDAILTGSVSRRSGQLRITAELVQVATGVQLWGNTYDRAASEIVSVQDEIARAIMDEGIRLRLTSAERRALARHPTEDPEAYEWYLRSRHAVFRGSEEDIAQAREYLTRAIARDPKFARAYTDLGATYVAAAMDGFERPTEAFPEAIRNYDRARAIEPGLHEVLFNSASYAFFFNWDWATAERFWNIADQTTPSDLPTQELIAHALAHWALGQLDESIRIIRKLRQIDPLTTSYVIFEADFLFHAGQLEGAVALYEKTLNQEPTETALLGLAEVRRAQGRFDDAIETRRRASEIAGDDYLTAILEGAKGAEGYRRIEKAALEQELETLRARAEIGYVSPLDFARAHAQLGNTEQAFGYFDAAFADRAPGLVFLKVDTAWDPIRNDPRFLAAARRVGLP